MSAFAAAIAKLAGKLPAEKQPDQIEHHEAIVEKRKSFTEEHSNAIPSAIGRPTEIVLGIDFGTTATKRVGRLPYRAGAPAFAIPVPELAQAEGQAYLWASKLWRSKNGLFSLFPLEDGEICTEIKASLLLLPHLEVQRQAYSEENATAFLALQLKQSTDWLNQELAAVFRSGYQVWSYNFGFPAASLDKKGLRISYERCVAAALFLLGQKDDITISAVQAALSEIASRARVYLESSRAALVPEIAAAVAGFAMSNQHEDGLYAIVDVGGSTTDCCTFNLFHDRLGQMRCPIFEADVQLLGIEPWRRCKNDDERESFKFKLDCMLQGTIWKTKKRRHPTSARWDTGLPLFLIGGGSRSEMHSEHVRRLSSWLRRNSGQKGNVLFMPLRLTGNFDHKLCPGEEVHRLAVAHGLSLPVVDIPEIDLPGAIDDFADAAIRDTSAAYIEK